MQPVVIGDVIWEPSADVIAKSRLKRFMERHDIATFEELLHRADADIEWFWDAAIKDIDIAFFRHYDKVVDLSKGKPWATWWIGGSPDNLPGSPVPRPGRGLPAKKALV